MALPKLEGEVDVEYEEGLDGHRDYFITWLVSTPDKWIGPHLVMQTPGLPTPGTGWTFGPTAEQDARENDVYAVCQRYAKIVPKIDGGPNYWWLVRQQFSTRPYERPSMLGNEYTTPFNEKPKIRGSFVKKTEEGVYARTIYCVADGGFYGMRSNLIRNTAWQRFSGKQVEFERNCPRILIQMNFIDHGNNITFMQRWIDHVNEDVMWGYVARSVKLEDVSFERMCYAQDQFFFVANLEFEIDERYDPIADNYYSGHDRRILNYGDDQIRASGSVDNPSHVETVRKIPDREKSRVILDQNGRPWIGTVADASVTPPYVNVEYWGEADFVTELGIPATI